MGRFNVLAGVLVLGLSTSAIAASATTIVEDVPIIVNERTGEVLVVLEGPEGEEFVEPTNAQGILQSGRFQDGDLVDVEITEDRGRHRGHVTVLK